VSTTLEDQLARRRALVPAAISYPPELPVSACRDELLAAIRDHQVVIVAGETGSGKTTQLPKVCLELGRGVERVIAHTQPRRLAARTVAARIAQELGVPLGGAVGYAVRFNDRSGEDTLVRVMTDGLLLAEIQRDPLLRRYDTIIVDEAHERSLNVDFLLGVVKRILPRRPELKLIVTSATIDPERFSRHFDGAPIVEVSGRTHPVELRWRPLEEPASDELDGIADAVDELLADTRGDVLVFLSGEREIRDASELLRGRLGARVEVLPLYARLSSAEQQRVFEPHGQRRIVLATNVAETSLTVPGIRSVVDPGSARISRYSARLKVQRLPIEPVSQASADQRKGRCGREAPGVCIRLYDAQDFARRPRFTDPEILRTSLASVILQMAALGLGSIEDFPFMDPPDRRQVRDGIRLLHELGALDERERLTRLGRRLARLPVDPRLGRMVLEADRLGCAQEVIVIAAALSIQDPRERVGGDLVTQQAADAAHARFVDPEQPSDFLTLLSLWRHLRERQRELSGNQFRKHCHEQFLHYLRVREWQDLVGQLREAAKAARVTVNHEPAAPREIHSALLAGLLSHVGMREERGRDGKEGRGGRRARDSRSREYLGARGARFALSPGSALSKRPPEWVMVAELVETTRLWGRTAAAIDPRWIEPLARHLVTRAYDTPRWDRRRAAVIATERVSLYGLPIVTGRTVPYGRVDPQLSRLLFIRAALVEGAWEADHAFLRENRRRLAEAQELEHRARRRGIVADEQTLVDFYAQRIPAEVVSGRDFERWWREERLRDPERLLLPRELLVRDAPAAALDEQARPRSWRAGELALRLSYRFEPGSERDGVTVHVPLAALAQLRAQDFEWLVPGLREELVTALLRALPKEQRRRLAPLPETVAALLAAVDPAREPLRLALSRELEALRGVRVAPETWDLAGLPAHLRMRFCVEEEGGRVLAEGGDLDALREALLAQVHADVRGRLLSSIPSPVPRVARQLDSATSLALAAAPHADVGALLDDVVGAALDALLAEAGGPAADEAAFAALRERVAGGLAERTLALVRDVVAVLALARDVQRRLDALPASAALQPARLDLARQLGRLVFPGFVAATGAARLPDLQRYLRAMLQRLERLPHAPAPDRDKLRAINELEDDWERRRAACPPGRPLPDPLREARWAIEELRVAQFAHGLAAPQPVSAKRVRKLLEQAMLRDRTGRSARRPPATPGGAEGADRAAGSGRRRPRPRP
jgi:ATP-dependent RNA helicase HrpA